MSLFLHKITLTQFRNYDALRVGPLDKSFSQKIIVLTGDNGAGKTNVLEAISMLTPGRGMRGGALSDLKNRQADMAENWGIAADIIKDGHLTRLGTGGTRDGKRRLVRMDGQDLKGRSALADLMAVIWLTPQMDRLFLDGRSTRRKFLDRLAFAYTPSHVTHLNRYEKNMRQRMRVLQDHKNPDGLWLTQLEKQLAADAVMIAVERNVLIEKLHAHMDVLKRQESLFPVPDLSMMGAVEDILKDHSALATEEILQQQLAENRKADARNKRTAIGTHRSDLSVVYTGKDMPADQCSTGEQKGLLLSIVLAHAQMMQAEKGFVPILLLDEVAAHLDEDRRLQLFSILEHLGGQVWMTGTDVAIFKALEDKALFFDVQAGRIFPQVHLRAVALPQGSK